MKVRELVISLQGNDDHGMPFDQEAEIVFCTDVRFDMEVLSIYPDTESGKVVVDID